MRCMSIFFFLLLLALHPRLCIAQGVIYKCSGSKGHVSYQTEPCSVGSKLAGVKSYDAMPFRDDIARKLEADRDALRLRRQREREPSDDYVYPPADTVPYKVQVCRAAKARRQQELVRVGLKRTYDFGRRLDAEVYDACKYAPGA